MISKQYDIAIIGGSLSARIAAALLAKQGSKVLFLRNREAKAPAWFHSSIFLENLLGVLGGRSCFAAQKPIQVISKHCRLTISSDLPLEDELTREFGEEGAVIHQWLTELHQLGVRLEELFWENGGLPWSSFKANAGFKILSMRRKLNLAELEKPVNGQLDGFSPAARTFLTDLLQGLSLTALGELTYARAAMLWTHALRPENLVEPDFSELLNKRFEQFHGSKAALDELVSLDFDGSRWTGGQFKEGGRFTAQHFLLGDKRWADKFKAGLPELPIASRTPRQFKTSDLSGQLSPLLGKRVICGGQRPMRLAIEEQEDQLVGLLLSSAAVAEEDIRPQLEGVLPFADYQLAEDPAEAPPQKSMDAFPSLTNLPIRLGANLYCADRTLLLPEMGAPGAAMLAWTITKNLGNGRTDGKV